MNLHPSKRIKWTLTAIFGCVVIAAIISWCAGVVAAKRLDNYIVKLKSEGAVLEIEDLRSRRPVGTQFFEGPIEDSATAFLFSDGSTDFDDAALWQEVSRLTSRVRKLGAEESEKVREIVEEKKELVARIKRICNLPPTRIEDIIEITGMRQSFFDTKTPNLLLCRNASNLLVMDAYLAYKEGRTDDALESGGDVLKLGKHMQDLPNLIGNMTGVAISAIPSEFLSQIIVDADFSEQAVTSFLDILEGGATQESLALAYTGELLGVREAFRIVNHLEQLNTSRAASSRWGAERLAAWLYGLPFFRYMRVMDEKLLIATINQWVEQYECPYYQVKDEYEVIQNQNIGWITPFSKSALPNLARAKSVYVQAELNLIRLKTALAVNQYRKDAGDYPGSLTALTPKYLAEAPTNPETGRLVALEYLNAEDMEERRKANPQRRLSFFYVRSLESRKHLLID